MPVIAAVHGVAFGGGFQIMLGADMRYATADTRFSVMEIKWGLVPDLAGTQLMRHLAREDVVRELTYTGRIFNGTEAQQLGFVTKIVDDPRAAALETAKEIANKSPDAVRAAKRILNDAVAVDAATGLMAEFGRAAEADRLAQPARGDHVEPAEARRQLQGLTGERPHAAHLILRSARSARGSRRMGNIKTGSHPSRRGPSGRSSG